MKRVAPGDWPEGGVGRLGKGEGARDVRPEEDDASGGGPGQNPQVLPLPW